MLVICMDDPFSSCAHDSWLFPMTYGSWKNIRTVLPEKAFFQKLNLSSKLSSNAHCDLTGKNMCLFLAIHLAIIYNIGRIKFEKKLESSKKILTIYPFSLNYLPYSGKRIILIITRHFLFIWTFIDYMPVQKISREIAYVSFTQSKKNVQLYLSICNLHLNKIFLGFTDPSHLRFGVPFLFKF